MTIPEFYKSIGGDYDDLLSRLRNPDAEPDWNKVESRRADVDRDYHDIVDKIAALDA